MFKRHEVRLMSNPACSNPVKDLVEQDFFYYDKDGFELNLAEQKFYRAMGYPIDSPILNHCCWQEPWFELEKNVKDIFLDHSMFLCRCSYVEQALNQLKEIKSKFPIADYLINTKTKWGYDFALDAVKDGTAFEVIHVEYDSRNYDIFSNHMLQFDYTVRHTDWKDAANKVWNQRNQWEGLTGFEQNHWKAKFLLGWKLSEYTEKSI